MTGYVGLIAAPATAYLWIVRERKKEKELENKREDQYQVKVSELNTVQIEAINQFYDKEKYLAGAFALSGLIDEWIYLSKIYQNHQRANFIKIEQISSILFTRHDEVKEMPHQFKILEKEIIVKLIKLQQETGQMFDWSKYTFVSFSFGSNINEFPGLELPYKNSFVGAKLLRATFTHTDFTMLNLMGISSNKSYFSNSYFNGTNLNNSEFIETDFREGYLPSAKFKDAVLHDSDFFKADLSNADLRNADLTDVRFNRANLENADLRGTILKNTDFTSANLKGAMLEGATIDNTFFKGAEISGIDLTGKEFKNADFPYVRINGNVCSTDEKDLILEGHLQTLFKK
ncbi:pentapeptide repeat-containing protein [Lactococcus petauri]|uniref:pentapeptide repeat-containing protein n=1 Tax=Lactococcus petauri TaxID=1940789 RepID=UPI003852BB93